MKYNSNNKPLVCMQTQSTCYNSTSLMNVRGILVHSTGCNNPNLRRYVQPSDNAPDRDAMLRLLGRNTNGNDWNHTRQGAGLNAWIGKLADGTVTTVQTMPWNYRPWGCGSGPHGSCNNGWIQFEICEDNLQSREYFNKTYQETVELVAYLCSIYGLNPAGTAKLNGVTVPVILCHIDSNKLGLGSAHSDVLHWWPKFGKDMNDFRRDVKACMSGGSSNAAKPETPAKTPAKKPAATATNPGHYLVKVTASALNIRSGPGTGYKVTGSIHDKGTYTIVDTKGNWGKLKSGAGWICLDYTTRK